jgi:hypothetical protein
MDAAALLDERCCCDGEIAWSWRPDAGVKLAADSDVGLTADTPETASDGG